MRALARVTRIAERTGAVAKARQQARGQAEAARDAVSALPASARRDRLECFAEAVISRNR